MKVAAYTITKNEEQFVGRWADSCADADYRLVVDTGSTDNTASIALESGCEVGYITIRPWRFETKLDEAITKVRNREVDELLDFQKTYADTFYNKSTRINEWIEFLKQTTTKETPRRGGINWMR